ncbi:hypothetical protein ACFL2B_01370 [Patescibacteria group bacterium]
MKTKNNKPVIGIFGLSSDEGCEFPILDQGEKLLELLEEVELGHFRLVEELPDPKQFDVALVEGSVLTKDNIAKLKKIRERSKILVALGACAIIGGIPELKNYVGKDKAIEKVYKDVQGIDNLEVKPLSAYVKVDFAIPGCPVDGGEVLRVLYELKEGRIPEIPKIPVCHECQIRETECLLKANEQTGRQAEPCMGPISYAGCNAPCPAANYPCDGCRGVLPEADFDSFAKAIDAIGAKERIKNIFERYGNKDIIEKLTKEKDEN